MILQFWGCGGSMRPAYYADLDRQTAEFLDVRGQRLRKIASGGDDHIAAQEATLEANDPEGGIGLYLDEWGTWYEPTPGASALHKQNTMRGTKTSPSSSASPAKPHQYLAGISTTTSSEGSAALNRFRLS